MILLIYSIAWNQGLVCNITNNCTYSSTLTFPFAQKVLLLSLYWNLVCSWKWQPLKNTNKLPGTMIWMYQQGIKQHLLVQTNLPESWTACKTKKTCSNFGKTTAFKKQSSVLSDNKNVERYCMFIVWKICVWWTSTWHCLMKFVPDI